MLPALLPLLAPARWTRADKSHELRQTTVSRFVVEVSISNPALSRLLALFTLVIRY
jgi:hypothetical protein